MHLIESRMPVIRDASFRHKPVYPPTSPHRCSRDLPRRAWHTGRPHPVHDLRTSNRTIMTLAVNYNAIQGPNAINASNIVQTHRNYVIKMTKKPKKTGTLCLKIQQQQQQQQMLLTQHWCRGCPPSVGACWQSPPSHDPACCGGQSAPCLARSVCGQS